jgi:hypothetical protein
LDHAPEPPSGRNNKHRHRADAAHLFLPYEIASRSLSNSYGPMGTLARKRMLPRGRNPQTQNREIGMIGIAHHREPRMATLVAALSAALQTIRDGIESYAEYRAERAVSAAQWQSADDEIGRYRRLIHAGK